MIWPADLEEFNKTTQGEFSGVGIQIQSDEDGSLKVLKILSNASAVIADVIALGTGAGRGSNRALAAAPAPAMVAPSPRCCCRRARPPFPACRS